MKGVVVATLHGVAFIYVNELHAELLLDIRNSGDEILIGQWLDCTPHKTYVDRFRKIEPRLKTEIVDGKVQIETKVRIADSNVFDSIDFGKVALLTERPTDVSDGQMCRCVVTRNMDTLADAHANLNFNWHILPDTLLPDDSADTEMQQQTEAETGNEENDKQTTSEAIAVTEEDVIASINQLIHDKRINFADWDGPKDIYPELDEVSKAYGGLTDSLLKPCLLKVLEQHLSAEGPSWMRQHLETLIKAWKKEVMDEGISYERETRVLLQSRQIVPPQEETRKRKRANKDLRKAFGVGMFLQQQTLKTEQGVLDIDEDDAGNYKIEGQELSFESWAKFNDTEITTPIVMKEPPKTPASVVPSKEEWEKMRFEKIMAKKAKRKAAKAAMKAETESGEKEGTPAETKVLEEGEVDSGEEHKSKSKRLKAARSSSSSSSESDDDVSTQGSRHRRKERRKKERMGTVKAASARLPGVLQSLYDNRIGLLNLLSAEHRTLFAGVLNGVISNQKAVSTSQRELIFSRMSAMMPGN